MRFFPSVLMLSCLAMFLVFLVPARTAFAGSQSASASANTLALHPGLPPRPKGKTTVIGGAIGDVDPVRDELTLKVFGGRPIKVLYDERTQIFQDGIKTPLRDLHATGHASVETVLDGTQIFAVSIHMLKHAPTGECQGQVVNYNPATGELAVSSALSHEPIQLRVPSGAHFVRVGQAAASAGMPGPADLVKGTLVSVEFESQNQGQGIARQVAILATPGSSFVFTGKIIYLDLHSNVLVLTDPRDNTSHKIFFDADRFPVSQHLREGSQVRVTANFNGSGYDATDIQLK